jgi:hypothetical protein
MRSRPARAQERQQVLRTFATAARAVGVCALALLHAGDAQVRAEERALEAVGFRMPSWRMMSPTTAGRGRGERQHRDRRPARFKPASLRYAG